MAGYSGTPLARKLGIKEDHLVTLVQAPKGFEKVLGSLPAGVTLRRDLRGSRSIDVAVLFVKKAAVLHDRFPRIAQRLAKAGGLWVGWPKKASGVPTEVAESDVRAYGLSQGLVDNKICAIDDTWSGLRFVIRREDR